MFLYNLTKHHNFKHHIKNSFKYVKNKINKIRPYILNVMRLEINCCIKKISVPIWSFIVYYIYMDNY